MKKKNTFKQLVILGGNIYKQDFPIINIINAINKFKLKIFVITDNKRLYYPNKKFLNFKEFLNNKKIPFKSFLNSIQK